MTTVKHPHSKSTAAKIRRLILRGMPNKDIADKLACPYGYVATIRSKMNTQSQSGIASLPTVTAPPGDMSEMVYQISRGRGRPPGTPNRPKEIAPHPAMNAFIPESLVRFAEETMRGKVEEEKVVTKYRVQQWMAVAVVCVLLAALVVYESAK